MFLNQMAFSYEFLIHISFVITFSQALLIFEKCTRHSQCPANARCRPNGCEGYMCQCVSKFVYSDDKSQCVPGKLMGEDCDGNLNRCLSPFAVCMDGVCQCNELMEPTSDGHCKSPYEAELHHSCVDKICCLSTVCDGEVCVCPEDKREITAKEYWLDPLKARKCVDKTYSVDHCHGQEVLVPEDLLIEENNVIQSNKSVSQIVDKVQASDNIYSNKEQEIASKNKDKSRDIQGTFIEKEIDNSGPNDVKSDVPSEKHDEKTVDQVEERTVIKDSSYSDVVDSKAKVNDHYTNKSDDTTSEMLQSSENSQNKTHPKNIDTNVKDGAIDEVPSDITEDFPTNVLSKESLASEEGLTKYSVNQNATLKIGTSSSTTEQRNHDKNDEFLVITKGNFHNADNFTNKTLVPLLRSAYNDDEGHLNQLVKLLIGRFSERNKKVDIYHGCSLDEECPEHAQCRKRGCSSLKQCLCRDGFMTNVNGTYCVQDGARPCLINEFKCLGSRCVPYSYVCDGVTDCPQNDDETKLCSSHRMDVLPRQHLEVVDRLEEKLEHEALMRMHLERSIQDLRDVIKEIKQKYINVAQSDKANVHTHKTDPIALQTPSPMGEDEQISTWNDPFYDGFIDNIQNKLKGSAVYTLWGGKVCPKHENIRTIYTGFMSSSSTVLDRGAGADFLCLPQVPEYDSSSFTKKVINEQKSVVSGFTYHLSCSVCQVQLVSTVLMIPAKVTCPADWRLEYVGVLVTAGVKKSEGGMRHICIEKTAFYDGVEDSRDKGPYLFPVAVECGRIPCLPYKRNDNLSCVVCSF